MLLKKFRIKDNIKIKKESDDDLENYYNKIQEAEKRKKYFVKNKKRNWRGFD